MSHRRIATLLLLVVVHLPARASAQPRAERKEEADAALLSFLIPGLGSKYAGNERHFTAHFAIAAASVFTFASANSRNAFCESACLEVSGATLLTYIVNDVWSIVTAARDARDRNDELSSAIPLSRGLVIQPTSHEIRFGYSISF